MGNKCCSEFFWCCSCPWDNEKHPNLPPKPLVDERPRPETFENVEIHENVDFLVIQKWNLELELNGKEHHTSNYAQMKIAPLSPKEGKEVKSCCLLRRGQMFNITLELNMPYDREKHKISLIFSVEDCNANFGNETQIGIMVGDEEGMKGWWVKVHSQEGSSLTLQIHSPGSAIVGEWKLEIDIVIDRSARSFSCPGRMFLLFNPWCEDDSVYLEDEDERQEWVLNDSGLIWRGTHSRLRPCPWQFGQFEKDILECVLYVLKKLCLLLPAHMANPVKVVRALSAGVNSPDDSGILVGNWSGKYEGGRSPVQWRGSVEILQKYFAKKKSVKYGQCWVFSGVLTTACRTLGIPCRSVTNFSSAHDTHDSLTIDYIFGDDGEAIKELNIDSVWNFHVWNEAWMKRNDLGDEYSGWQVIDATPQEQSDGQFRCGPSSLVAIKRGEIYRPYDVSFVYAEVNADKLYWKYQGKRQPMKLLGRKTGGIGLCISTKAINGMRREDITHLYKHKEESKEEREVMMTALRRCQNAFARYYLNQKFEDIEFSLDLKDDIVIGQPFTVNVTVKNKSDNEHDVSVALRADTMLYTGLLKETVKNYESHIIIKPYSKQEVETLVTFEEYYNKLVDQCAFNISCLGKVKNTNFEYFAQDDFRVRKPDITIKCHSEEVSVGETSKWTASFENPIPMKLTKGKFYINPTCGDSVFVKLKNPIDEKTTASVDFEITPLKEGEMTVSVIFTSKELEDVDGFITQLVSLLKKPELLKPDDVSLDPEKDANKPESNDEKGET